MDSVAEIFILEDESFTLDCSYVGFPAPNITWMLNDSVVTSNSISGIHIVDLKSTTNGTSRLTRNTLTSSRDGKYSCVLTNTVGTASATFNVQTAGKISIWKHHSIQGHVGAL